MIVIRFFNKIKMNTKRSKRKLKNKLEVKGQHTQLVYQVSDKLIGVKEAMTRLFVTIKTI